MNLVMKDISEIRAGDTIFRGDSRGYLVGYKIQCIEKVAYDLGPIAFYVFIDENDDKFQIWGTEHKYLCIQGEEK
jgi:hypothetical protein